MTITRTVGGMAGPRELTFELTSDELYSAYMEVRSANDREEVLQFIDDLDDDDLKENYGCNREEAESNAEELAELYRSYVEDGDYFYTKLESAFEDFFKSPGLR